MEIEEIATCIYEGCGVDFGIVEKYSTIHKVFGHPDFSWRQDIGGAGRSGLLETSTEKRREWKNHPMANVPIHLYHSMEIINTYQMHTRSMLELRLEIEARPVEEIARISIKTSKDRTVKLAMHDTYFPRLQPGSAA